MEKVALDDSSYFWVYRSQPLLERSDAIERVFVLIHGLERNGNVYYRTAIAATGDAGELDRTLVIAPEFHANDGKCDDKVDRGETVFPCRGWSDGLSDRKKQISSFAALDRLVQMVANPDRFRALKEIVVAGHSAGAQFAQRYAAANRIDGALPVPMRYVVANASSYLYLESWRPVRSAESFCPEFNRYKFGLDGMNGYLLQTGAEAIKRDYPRRNVTYLLGRLDTTDEHDMDTSCPAMAEGPNRLARGVAYFNRLNQTFRTAHKLLEVPGCGHSVECMYRSSNGLKTVFGSQ